MWTKSVTLTEPLSQYVLSANPAVPDELLKFHQQTLALPGGQMVIPLHQMHLMQFFLRFIQAKKVLELGTFSGFSALIFALAIPENGTVVTCDISDEMLSVGKPFWQHFKMDKKIHFFKGSALDCLDQQSKVEKFDFIFIDADKSNLQQYVEKSLALLSPKGMIAVDNTLFQGEVANPENNRQIVKDIRAFNDYLKTRTDLNVCLLPVADGLTLVSRCE